MPFFNFIETLSVLWWKKFEDELEHVQCSVGNANCWCNQGLRGYINMCLTICQHDPLYHTPPSGKELLFSIEADKSEVSNDSTWAREDVQDSNLLGWTLPFTSSTTNMWVTASCPPPKHGGMTLAFQPHSHPYFSSCFYPGWIVEQMVLRKLAYNMEKSKTRVSYRSGL